MERIFKNFFFSIALLNVVTIQAASTPTKTDDLEPCNKRPTHKQPVSFNDIELSLLKKIEDGGEYRMINGIGFWVSYRKDSFGELFLGPSSRLPRDMFDHRFMIKPKESDAPSTHEPLTHAHYSLHNAPSAHQALADDSKSTLGDLFFKPEALDNGF